MALRQWITAQGATVDHSLFAPSASISAERAYVALARGRETNRIYATTDRAWEDAIAIPRTHTFATDQTPDLTGRTATRDAEPSARDREAGVDLDLDNLPDDLEARRAAVRAAARHHTATPPRSTPHRAQRPWPNRHTDDGLEREHDGNEHERHHQHEPVADDGRDRAVVIGI